MYNDYGGDRFNLSVMKASLLYVKQFFRKIQYIVKKSCKIKNSSIYSRRIFSCVLY